MKHRIVIIAIILSAVAAGLWADPPDRVGRLNYIQGTLSFKVGGVDEWVPGVLNYPLTTGDELWTDAGGRAELHVSSTAIRMDSRTNLSVFSLDDQTVRLFLYAGSLAVRVRALDPSDAIEVDTPAGIFSLNSPGSYRIDVADNGDTTAAVWNGDVTVSLGSSTLTLTTGQAEVIANVSYPSITMELLPRPGDWDEWYFARDRREDNPVSVRYVPRDLIGCEDLDYYGTWEVIAGYGPVWVPTDVRTGWVPYSYGHWAWVKPWGWTWISDEPWGFAPFHYGRWANVSGRWVWVPGSIAVRPVYAPALVVFIGGDDWVLSGGIGIGWFPLAPHEVYVPPYTTNSAYVRRVNMGQANVDRAPALNAHSVYANRSVARAVTVVSRDAFVRSEPVERAVISVPQRDILSAPVRGATVNVSPQRESIIARPAPVTTQAARPPVVQRAPAARTPQAVQPQERGPVVVEPRAPQQPQDVQPQERGPIVVVPRTPQTTQPQTAQPGRNGPVAAAPKAPDQRAPAAGDSREKAGAASLVSSVRQRLAQVDRRVAADRNAQGNPAVSRPLASARSTVAEAEKNLAAGNYGAASQKAEQARSLLDQVERLLASSGQEDRSGAVGQGSQSWGSEPRAARR